MNEFVQVLRLDSKYRVSGTGSQFEIELADNLQCGPSTVCHVAAVSFPVSMMTIEEGINDRFYHTSASPKQNSEKQATQHQAEQNQADSQIVSDSPRLAPPPVNQK